MCARACTSRAFAMGRMVIFLKLFEIYYVIFLDKIHHINLHACLDHVHISKLACQELFFFIRFQSAEPNKQLNQNILFFKRIYIIFIYSIYFINGINIFKNVSLINIESHNKEFEITRFQFIKLIYNVNFPFRCFVLLFH